MGKRPAHPIPARASAGFQAAKKAIPQLILDGMARVEHVHVAMMTCHPMQLQPTLFPPVEYATRHGATDDNVCMRQRASMLVLIQNLSNIVNAAPRYWWDVVGDACQFRAARSSHKCVSYFFMCFGFWFFGWLHQHGYS